MFYISKNVDGLEVSIVHKATINWAAHRDLAMVYEFNGVHNFGGINCKPLIESIRNKVNSDEISEKGVIKQLSQ